MFDDIVLQPPLSVEITFPFCGEIFYLNVKTAFVNVVNILRLELIRQWGPLLLVSVPKKTPIKHGGRIYTVCV